VRGALPIRRRSRRLPVLAAAAVAAAVATTFVAPWALGPGVADPAAAEVLVRAADAVAAEPVGRPGQFWEVETRGTSLSYSPGVGGGEAAVLVEQDGTAWLPVGDANTRWERSRSFPLRALTGNLTPEELRLMAPVAGSTTKTVVAGRYPAGWQTPTDAWLAALPRDPARLRDKLYADTRGQGRSPDGEVVVAVADVLRSGRVPADLRASLYRVLTTVPGVRITATRATVLGRPGIALGRLETVDGRRQEIVVDPLTGQFVGERYVDEQKGWVTETTVRRTLVDRVPAAVVSGAQLWRCQVNPDGGIDCQK
jgi:RNA polymerase sigma-70 factor (ECF subfamily)